jgi:predicted PurR-regulated permease PerM
MLDSPTEAPRLAASPLPPAAANRWAVEETVPRGMAVAAAFSARLLLIAAAIALVGFVLSKLLVVVIPTVVAILLATALVPPARWLQRRGLPSHFAAMAVVLAGLFALICALALIVPQFVSELGDLGSKVEEGARKLAGSLAIEPLGLTEERLNRTIDRASKEFGSSGPQVLGGVMSGALIVAEVGAAILLTLVLTFFFVKDGERLWAWIESLFSEQRRQAVHEVGARSWEVLAAYMRGVALVATIDAVFIGLAIAVLGVPLLFPLTVLTFVAAFFPIIGAVVAGVAAVLVALVANGAATALILLIVIVVVQQLEGNVFYPVVVGPRLALHPVAILLSLAAGGVVAGLAGAFLAVPVTAVAGRLLDYARQRGHAPAPVPQP